MFILAKLFSAVTQPLTWIALAWCIGLWRLWRALRQSDGHGLRLKSVKRAAWALTWPLLLFALLGFVALPQILLRPLENTYAIPTAAHVLQHQGFVVLGGSSERPDNYAFTQQVPLNSAAERLTVPLAWLQRTSQTTQPMRLIFLGGEGQLVTTGISEAAMASQFFREQGIDPSRLQFESASRTTRENILALKRLLGQDCGKGHWLLVTSAWHMPRSMDELRAAGCHLTPYPVDFRSGPAQFHWTQLHDYAFVQSLSLWQRALHEWLGRAVYAATRGW